MNTSVSNKPDATCEIERIEGNGPAEYKTYLCGADARFVWHALPQVDVQVCPSCKRWLETLESLGQRIV